MKLLKPLLYSQMINPDFYGSLFYVKNYGVRNYSLHEPLEKIYDMITQTRYNYCIKYGNNYIGYYVGNNFLYKNLKMKYIIIFSLKILGIT
jgi:hypothetical protein